MNPLSPRLSRHDAAAFHKDSLQFADSSIAAWTKENASRCAHAQAFGIPFGDLLTWDLACHLRHEALRLHHAFAVGLHECPPSGNPTSSPQSRSIIISPVSQGITWPVYPQLPRLWITALGMQGSSWNPMADAVDSLSHPSKPDHHLVAMFGISRNNLGQAASDADKEFEAHTRLTPRMSMTIYSYADQGYENGHTTLYDGMTISLYLMKN